MEAFNRAGVEGKGERKKGEKSAKDAARRRAELEELKEKKEQANEDFKGIEEKASDVRTFGLRGVTITIPVCVLSFWETLS